MRRIQRLRYDKPNRFDDNAFIDGLLVACLFFLSMYYLPHLYTLAVTWFINH